jgi:predicted extracellular nuclease
VRLRFRLVLACLCAGLIVVGGGTATGAPTELFFSEYVEGSSFNKAVEIYNGTGAPVDLGASGYKLELYSNGAATASASANLTGSLANGDVFVVSHASASSTILAQADLQNSTVANWNGDDAVVLRKGATIVDVIGQIGSDPGTEWGTGLTSTADNTLRRKTSVEAGDVNGADAFDPAAEWNGFASDTFDGLGAHSLGDSAPTVTATSPLSGATGVDVDANITVTFSEAVNVTDPWATISCTSTNGHTAATSGGPTTFTLNPGSDFVAGETCTVTVVAAAVADQDANDPPNTMGSDYVFSFSTLAATTGVFFSEYVEGTSSNKAIEIYNGTGVPIDLAAEGYKIELYSNGSTSVGGTLNLSGSLASGDVFVAANPSASAAILAQADATSSSAINWNGNDAVVLRKGATVVDVIGQIGFDPGTEWGTGLTSTADSTSTRSRTTSRRLPTHAWGSAGSRLPTWPRS